MVPVGYLVYICPGHTLYSQWNIQNKYHHHYLQQVTMDDGKPMPIIYKVILLINLQKIKYSYAYSLI